jgi:pimeloyl-[acyl-carrier protein] synthase
MTQVDAASAGTGATGLPMSLIQLLDPEVRADPYPLYHALRAEDPVHWDPYLHAWVVTRYDDVAAVLTRFSADRTPTAEYFEALGVPELSPIARLMVQQMLFMDAPAHSRLRRLAGAAFRPARVRHLRVHIEQIAQRLLGDVLARGGATFDLMAEFAEPLPAIVTTELLGVPVEDHEQLKDWSVTFAEMLGNFQHNPDRVAGVRVAVDNLTAYFHAAVVEQRRTPRDGLLHDLLVAEVDGDRLTDEEIVANCIVTMVGGLETTTNLIGNGTLALLRDPDRLAELRADPGLIPDAVEELLRFESPSQHTARIAPADCVLGGRQIRAGQAVMAVMAAGNRDPERFPEPDRLRFDRPDRRHLAFGWAAHFCFGAPLARLEGHIAFDALLRTFPGLALTGEPLTWRENLGLRGLSALPLRTR